jgi:hypothetical protein
VYTRDVFDRAREELWGFFHRSWAYFGEGRER